MFLHTLYLDLDKYILFSHGSDLCADSELKHAMANCFEAFMGAVFLDGGINFADKVTSRSKQRFKNNCFLVSWTNRRLLLLILYIFRLGLHRISGWPQIRPFLKSGIVADIRFHLLDIRLKTVKNRTQLSFDK